MQENGKEKFANGEYDSEKFIYQTLVVLSDRKSVRYKYFERNFWQNHIF